MTTPEDQIRLQPPHVTTRNASQSSCFLPPLEANPGTSHEPHGSSGPSAWWPTLHLHLSEPLKRRHHPLIMPGAANALVASWMHFCYRRALAAIGLVDAGSLVLLATALFVIGSNSKPLYP
ncbi:hypothetical protein ACJZ2D_005976 [Fusarium nematophilum]